MRPHGRPKNMQQPDDTHIVTLTVGQLRQLIREEVSNALKEKPAVIEKYDDDVLDINQLAKYLKVDRMTVYRYRRSGKLPKPGYVGTRPRWSRREIDEFNGGFNGKTKGDI